MYINMWINKDKCPGHSGVRGRNQQVAPPTSEKRTRIIVRRRHDHAQHFIPSLDRVPMAIRTQWAWRTFITCTWESSIAGLRAMHALLVAILASALVGCAQHNLPFSLSFWSVRAACTPSQNVHC